MKEAIIDIIGFGMRRERAELKADEILELLNSKYTRYNIDFNGNCKAGIEIKNNEPKIIGAMDGWGNPIRVGDIKITFLSKTENI